MERNREIGVFIRRTHPDSVIPTQGYEDDAGHDLYSVEDVWIPAKSFIDISTGISVAMPPHHWGFIVSRSSTIRKHNLRVEPAIIDPGYRGEMFIGVWNLSDRGYSIQKGTRLAQLIFMDRVSVDWHEVDILPSSTRGSQGFGSSGE